MKKRRVENSKSNLYENVTWIPTTSTMVERLFSTAKHFLPDDRKNLSPYRLEATLFMRSNQDLWDAKLVNTVVKSMY